jgi:hypothetical protein
LSSVPSFAHASEAEMARILDFYAVRWEYEPHTFPILWDLEGAVLESFAPDFYLPDLDLYLEMTTLKQRLVRKKNRKLRRLRELYPDLRIKLFYARDFRMLMLKYGKLALHESLSGTTGQVVPVRSPDVAADVGPAPLAEIAIEAVLEPSAADLSAAAGPNEPANPPSPIPDLAVVAPAAAAARARRRRRARRASEGPATRR